MSRHKAKPGKTIAPGSSASEKIDRKTTRRRHTSGTKVFRNGTKAGRALTSDHNEEDATAGDSDVLENGLTTERQRARKTSKPQKIWKNVKDRPVQSCHDTMLSSLKLEKQPQTEAPKCTHPVQESQILDARNRSQTETGEEVTVKSEMPHGFVVDQWCDLGPSVHKEGHSPLLTPPMLTIKESPDSTVSVSKDWNDKTLHSAEIPVTNNENKAEIQDSTGCGLKFSGPNEDIHQLMSASVPQEQEPFRMSSVPENPLFKYRPSPFPLHTLVQYPVAPSGDSYSLPINPFPVAFHTSWPVPFQMTPTALDVSTGETRMNAFGLSASQVLPEQADSGHQVSCRTSRGKNRADQVQGHSGPLSQTSSTHVSGLNNESKTKEAEGLIFERSNPLSDGSLYPKGPVLMESFSSAAFLPPSPFLQQSSFHSGGMMMLLPQHPHFFLPVLSALNCSQALTDKSTLLASVKAGQEGDKRKRVDKSSYREPASPPPMGQEAQITRTQKVKEVNSVVLQSFRPTLKPRMAGAADFLDPTRLKFGVDDDGFDEELKTKGCSDSSDEEWQPTRKSSRAEGEESDSGDDSHIDGEKSAAKGENSEKLTIWGKKTSKRRRRSLKGPVKCPICGKLFNGEYHLRRHKMSHSDVRPHQCPICQKSFKQKAHLTGHQIVHERVGRPANMDNETQGRKKKGESAAKYPGRPKKTYSEKDLSCKECGKSFKTVYRLKRHEQSHTDIRPFSCRICGKGFKQTGHRNEHEANHEKTQKRFLCNLCGVVFRCRSSFNNHMRSHSVEKLRLQKGREDSEGKPDTGEIGHTGYDCPYCTEKFATAQALNSHLESHVEVQQRRHVQPYSCDVCRRAFTYRHNLLKHKLIHKAPEKFAQFYKEKMEAHVASGKPSFKCFKCSKIFLRKETLAKHFKIHSGNKPYKCAICSRDFTQNVHLKVHMRKHTGSRPFQCRECSKSFIDSTALAKHVEYEACHAENYMYNCKICEKRHYYLGSIKQHIRREHCVPEEGIECHILKTERLSKRRQGAGGEKYSCKVCSCHFSEKCNLVRHIKRKHTELVELLNKNINGQTSDCNREAPIAKSKAAAAFPEGSLDRTGTHAVQEATGGVKCDHVDKFSVQSSEPLAGKPPSPLTAVKDREELRYWTPVGDGEREEGDYRTELLQGFNNIGFVYNGNSPQESRCCRQAWPTSESNRDTRSDSLKRAASEDPLTNSLVSEKEVSSLTDIHFLYNIGLIVSKKARRVQERDTKENSSSRKSDTDREYPYSEADDLDSDTVLAKSLDSAATIYLTPKVIQPPEPQGGDTAMNENHGKCQNLNIASLNGQDRTGTANAEIASVNSRESGCASEFFQKMELVDTTANPDRVKAYRPEELTEANTREAGMATATFASTTAQCLSSTMEKISHSGKSSSPNFCAHENCHFPSTKQMDMIHSNQPTSQTSQSELVDTSCPGEKVTCTENVHTKAKTGESDAKFVLNEEQNHSFSWQTPNCVSNFPMNASLSLGSYLQDEYEACPTESHLRHLGLLACKDAQEIKSKSYPLQVQYATFKPWLEELVLTTRPRHNKDNGQLSSTRKLGKEANDEQRRHNVLTRKHVADTRAMKGSQEPWVGHEGPKTETCQSLLQAEEKAQGKRRRRVRTKEVTTKMEIPLEQTTPAHMSLPESSSRGLNASALKQTFSQSSDTDSQHVLPSSSSAIKASPPSPTGQNGSSLAAHPQVGKVLWETAVSCTSSPPTTPDSTITSKTHFPCQTCGKVFTARHQLKRHELTHTDRRPFSCDQCGRAFRQKVHLSDHIKRHEGQRPFVCAGCGKRFVLKNEMNQHIKNHCKGSAEFLKVGASGGDKPIYTIALSELTPILPGAAERSSVVSKDKDVPGTAATALIPKLGQQEFMTVCDQAYKLGDIISNGTITLCVVSPPSDHKLPGHGPGGQATASVRSQEVTQEPRPFIKETMAS